MTAGMAFPAAAVIAGIVLAAPGISACPANVVTVIDDAPRGVRVHRQPDLDTSWIGLRRGQRVRCLEARPVADKRLRADNQRMFKVVLPNGTPRGYEGWAAAQLLAPVPDSMIAFKVRFPDVGSGDAAIISVGKTDVVIDGGPNPRYLAKYLRDHHRFREAIDLVIISRFDPDHVAGLTSLRRWPIKAIWKPEIQTADSRSYGGLIAALHSSAREETPEDDSNLLKFAPEAPEIGFRIVRPPPVNGGDRISADFQARHASMILLLEIAGKKLLFTGDLVGKREDQSADMRPQFAESVVINRLRTWCAQGVDVLKVPNHGSDSSSTTAFIEAFKPKFAVISASPKNYLPAEEVVQRYKDSKAIVLRTDATRGHGNDDILCVRDVGENNVRCNYESILTE